MIREPSFAAVRDIAEQHQAAKFRYGSNKRTVLVDAFTASAIVAVHDALNDDNRAKIERMCASSAITFRRIAEFCLARV